MNTKRDNDVLEQNVSTLLGTGGEAPRISAAARSRIRATLVERHGLREDQTRRSPLFAVGLGLAATAVAAIIVTRVVGGGAGGTEVVPGDITTLADGSTYIVPPDGGRVEVIGSRHVRIHGAALLDVAPGKGAFLVETPSGRIEVLGTRFYVNAEQARTTAAVVRGSVKLASNDGEVTLRAGEQGIAEAGRAPTRGPAPRLSHLVSWAAEARRKSEKTVVAMRNGTLFARDPNSPWVPESPLPIVKLGIDVAVEDQVARVAIDQTFHNPSSSVMEGMYRFAIPPDAALQRLAMYVDGTLTEAAVVERMRARRIYEDVVYRRLDPALLEWAGTGRLSLRVYPLPAQQDKRLILAYTQSLSRLYDDYALSVPLPEVDLPVGELAFDVRIKGCAGCEISSTSHKLTVEKSGADATVTVRQKGVKLGDSLVLRVRDPRHAPLVSVARESGATAGDYLMVRARPAISPAATPRAYKPRTWVILDDVSASRGPAELRAQTDLIDGFVRELDEEDLVAVIAFDVGARLKLAPTRVLDVDRAALRKALAEEGGVGATDFAAALDGVRELVGKTPADTTIVYIGDGIITSGPRNLDAVRAVLAGLGQFVGVGVGDGPDTQTLEALAAATAGYATTIDLSDDLAWRAFDLVAALNTPRVTGLSARLVDAAGAVVPATAYVKTPQLADGEELELVAKITGPGTPVAVELHGTIEGTPWQQRIEVAVAKAPQGGYLPRLWAQRHVAARLLAKHDAVAMAPCAPPPTITTRGGDPAKPAVCPSEADVREQRDEGIRREVVDLGKRYFLLSRHTSLLVLENDDMYKKYEVEKGSGATWAPYVTPARLPTGTAPVTATTTPPATPGPVDESELLRQPLVTTSRDPQLASALDGDFETTVERRGGFADGVVMKRREFQVDLPRAKAVPAEERKAEKAKPDVEDATKTLADREPPADDGNGTEADNMAWTATADRAQRASRISMRDANMNGELSSEDLEFGGGESTGLALEGGLIGGVRGGKGRWWSTPYRLAHPTDLAYDDLTAFVPALSIDGTTAWRARLRAAAGRAKTHAMDDAARDQLAAARRALPTGVYRWQDFEIAVDDARRIGWRRTTQRELVETASFDGTTWTRRYAELGLDVTRALAEDDLALAFAYLPVWIAEPAHYARWFEVRLRKPREVALSRIVAGKPQPALVLVFDDRDRLVAIRDASDTDVVRVTWGPTGLASARVLSEDVSVGFTAQPVGDAPAWAHAGTSGGTLVELPAHKPAYWDARLATLAPGSAQWRHAQRQRMVAHAAQHQPMQTFAAYEALRTHGGVELGDLVLASGGFSTATDAEHAAAIAPFAEPTAALAATRIAKYVTAGRAYRRSSTPDALRPAVTDGMVGAVWALREVSALATHGKGELAAAKALALPPHAVELRLIAAGLLAGRGDVPAADAARVWDALAAGEYRNIARAAAAFVFARNYGSDELAERVARLVEDVDLRAPPANLSNLRYHVQGSRRGRAGWSMMWNAWRDRVLAGDSFEHVVSLLPVVGDHPTDLPRILDRAAQLAGASPDRVIDVARFAKLHGQHARATAMLAPLAKARPTREVLQLLGELAALQGRPAEALKHYEDAQDAGADEAVNLATVRNEMTQIIALAQRLAVDSSGPAREAAVARALVWGKRWRAVDPANPMIDRMIGQLLLVVGDRAEAWRQLSTVIERDPMSGTGYTMVAEAFEQQGRIAEALPYWQVAIVIEQTDPTPRLRKAKALIALGRMAEGDALLAEITGRTWHVRWDNVLYDARQTAARGKR